MFAILHALGMLVADLFKSRRRLETEIFLRHADGKALCLDRNYLPLFTHQPNSIKPPVSRPTPAQRGNHSNEETLIEASPGNQEPIGNHLSCQKWTEQDNRQVTNYDHDGAPVLSF
jgi:hypothetical protein